VGYGNETLCRNISLGLGATTIVPRTIGAWLFMRIIEPAAFIMTRRMLLGLKQRAEALATAGDGHSSRAA